MNRRILRHTLHLKKNRRHQNCRTHLSFVTSVLYALNSLEQPTIKLFSSRASLQPSVHSTRPTKGWHGEEASSTVRCCCQMVSLRANPPRIPSKRREKAAQQELPQEASWTTTKSFVIAFRVFHEANQRHLLLFIKGRRTVVRMKQSNKCTDERRISW